MNTWAHIYKALCGPGIKWSPCLHATGLLSSSPVLRITSLAKCPFPEYTLFWCIFTRKKNASSTETCGVTFLTMKEPSATINTRLYLWPLLVQEMNGFTRQERSVVSSFHSQRIRVNWEEAMRVLISSTFQSCMQLKTRLGSHQAGFAFM